MNNIDRLLAITVKDLSWLALSWRDHLSAGGSDHEVYIVVTACGTGYAARIKPPRTGQPFLILDGSGTLGLATTSKAWTTLADLNLMNLYRLARLDLIG